MVFILFIKGLFDENGNRFDPYILRIGPNINPAL
jgi:hypothetical protein